MSRRAFVRGEVRTVSAELAQEALATRWEMATGADFTSDVDVLNFALNLEYIEAAFYQRAATAGLVFGAERDLLVTLQHDEESHVSAIATAVLNLKGTPLARPVVKFGATFQTREKLLTTSHSFENVAAGSFLNAVEYLKDRDVLVTLARIFGVEARHAALVGNLLELPAEGGVFMGAFETPLNREKATRNTARFLPS